MQKEEAVAYFDVLSQNFPARTGERTENLRQDGRLPGWDSNRRPPEIYATIFTTWTVIRFEEGTITQEKSIEIESKYIQHLHL
jgi:hypothetical protein